MKKILIVEDDQLVATAYRKRFKDAGWEVEWAADGVEGIKAVGTIKPDVVLLDLLMPRLDGIEVLKYIRGNPDLRHLPVVVFSNSYMTNLIESAWRAGADQCLMKASTTPQSLFDSIAKAMQKAAARKLEGVASATPVAVPPVSPLGRPTVPLTGIPIPIQLGSAGVVFVEPKRPPVGPVPANRPALVPAVQPLAANQPQNTTTPSRIAAIPPTPPASPASPVAAPVAPAPAPAPAPVAAAIAATEPSNSTTMSSVPPLSVAETPAVAVTNPVDPEFQAQIRELFVAGSAAKMESVRASAMALAHVASKGAGIGVGVDAASGQFDDLFRKVHSLTGNAAVAGCSAIANYASTFEAFLQELQQKPRFLNASTLRTILKGIDFVCLLFRHALTPEPPEMARRILVVDSDPMSSQAIGLTLEKAGWRTHLSNDPIEAMTLASTEDFDLVVAAVEITGMSGFEACAQLQTLPGCASAPVLYVTSNDQFEAHSLPELLGDNEIIARPFLIIELTLKAQTLLETRRFRTHFASAA